MTRDLDGSPAEGGIAGLVRGPERIAAVEYDVSGRLVRSISAGGLFKAALGFAAQIAAQAPPDGRVAVAAGNTIDHLSAWLAVQLSGRVWIPLGLANGAEATAHALELCRPDLICADAAGRALLEAAGAGESLSVDAPATVRTIEPVLRSGAQTMAIKFTGGSTGRPKGVVQSCRAVMANWVNMDAAFPVGEGDVVLASAPLTHGSSHFILPALGAGARLVLVAGAGPEALADIMERERVTTGFMAPTAIQRLAEVFARRSAPPGALVRLIYGAAPFPERALARAIEVFGPRIAGLYGQTEAPMSIALITEAELARPGLRASVGRPGRLSNVVILGSDGAPLPAGDTGEITVSGPLVMDGYLDDAEKTARTLRAGRLHTGDLGHLDASGRLFVTRRASDLIISGGFNIHPAEVERALDATGLVGEACAFAVPDPDWGERLEAAVTMRAGQELDPEALRADLKARLGPVKTPKRIHVLDALPRNALGKLVRADIARHLHDA